MNWKTVVFLVTGPVILSTILDMIVKVTDMTVKVTEWHQLHYRRVWTGDRKAAWVKFVIRYTTSQRIRPCGSESINKPTIMPRINHYIHINSRVATRDLYSMMTSSNGNIFRVTGHLCGEFTGPRWLPRTKASHAELWCFLWSASE